MEKILKNTTNLGLGLYALGQETLTTIKGSIQDSIKSLEATGAADQSPQAVSARELAAKLEERLTDSKIKIESFLDEVTSQL